MEKNLLAKLKSYQDKAKNNLSINPDAVASNARKAAERICKYYLESAGKNPKDGGPTLENLIERIKNQKIQLADEKILLPMRVIQVYSNFGSHDQTASDLNAMDIVPCMEAFDLMMNIFQRTELPPENMSAGIKNTPSDFYYATSKLTVVDSIIRGWGIEELLPAYGLHPIGVHYKWSDGVLRELQSGNLDLAIYNKESASQYNAANPENPLHIIRDVCSSMGGRNFYILASAKGKWKDMTLADFKEALDSDTMIAVSKSSDMYKNLLYILDMTDNELSATGATVVDYHPDQGLSVFQFNPNMLVIGGQDFRYLARSTGDYIEIISYEDLPIEKQTYLYRNSINSLILGHSGYEKLRPYGIENIIDRLLMNFYRCCVNAESRSDLQNKLKNQLIGLPDSNDETASYVIQQILFETYRIM